MAARLGLKERERLAGRGFEPMRAERALSALRALLAERPEQRPAQVAVMAVHWPKLLRAYAPVPTLLTAVTSGRPRAEAARLAVEKREDLRSRLAAAPVGERPVILRAFVSEAIAQVLGFGDASTIDPRQRLFDLGLDSLTAVELRNRIQAGLQCSLRTTLVFDFPNLEALVEHLGAEVLGIRRQEQDVAPGRVAAAATEAVKEAEVIIAEMSDEEVEALIMRKLAPQGR